MALTKVTGHVIKSDTNIISHNINSSGIITAISFDGNVSGVAVTFTGDSTIGSLGITTNLTVGGISTFTGNIDANGSLDVDGHTELDNLRVSGVSTLTGRIFAGGTVIPGYSGADDLTIGSESGSHGITIRSSTTGGGGLFFSDATSAGDNSTQWAGGIEYNHGNGELRFYNGNNVTAMFKSGHFQPWSDSQYSLGTSSKRWSNLHVDGATIAGNATISGNLTVDGVLTYQDVTNIDSIGIVTARSDIRGGRNLSVVGISTFTGDVKVGSGGETAALGVRVNSAYAQIKLPDGQTGANKKGTLFFGDDDDFRIVFDAHHTYITSDSGDIYITNSAGNTPIKIKGNNTTELYHATTKVLETTSTGVSFNDLNLTNVGTIACDSIKGDADDNTNITFAGSDVITFKAGTTSPALTINTTQVKVEDDQELTIGTGNDLKIYHTTSGTSWIRHTNSSEYLLIEGNQMDFRDYATGVYRARMGAAVQLYYNGNNEKFRTTNTGISVTGEVASSQDYPNFRPTTDFNFAKTKRLDPNIRYYRTGTASYTDEDGFIRVVGEGEPRFDHDPATKESLGLLIEESRTNMVNHSENLGYSTWSMNNAATRFKPTTEAPDGKTSDGGAMTDMNNQRGVWEIVETSSNSTHLVYQQLSGGNVSQSVNYHISAFAKPGLNRTHFVLTEGNTLSATAIFDVANGTVTHTFGTGSPQAKISGPYGDGWYRCVLRYTTTSSQSYINIQLGVAQNGTTNSYAGDGSSSIAVWGVQIERSGTSETSYIQNWGRNNTRGREYIEVQNPNERFPLTVVSETSTKEFNYARRPFAMSPLGATDTIRPFINDSGNLSFFSSYNSGSYQTHTQSETGLAVNVPFKYAYAISSTSVSSPDKSCVNGGTVKSTGNTSLSETKLTQYRIGYSSAGDAEREWMGHVRRFMIYDTFLSDGNLKTITS